MLLKQCLHQSTELNYRIPGVCLLYNYRIFSDKEATWERKNRNLNQSHGCVDTATYFRRQHRFGNFKSRNTLLLTWSSGVLCRKIAKIISHLRHSFNLQRVFHTKFVVSLIILNCCQTKRHIPSSSSSLVTAIKSEAKHDKNAFLKKLRKLYVFID
jgi:hypothetical protein